MGLGLPALVFAGGLTIAARIWSAVRRVPNPFNDGPMSAPSRPMRWHRRQLLSAMTLFTCSTLEASDVAGLLRVEAGEAGCAAGTVTAMPNGVRRETTPRCAF